MNKKVNTFIIGQPRCGTTSLYSYLKLSRDIFLPEQKQLYHFEKDYNEYRMSYGVAKNMMRNYYNFSLEDYHKHFDNSCRHYMQRLSRKSTDLQETSL